MLLPRFQSTSRGDAGLGQSGNYTARTVGPPATPYEVVAGEVLGELDIGLDDRYRESVRCLGYPGGRVAEIQYEHPDRQIVRRCSFWFRETDIDSLNSIDAQSLITAALKRIYHVGWYVRY